jgi:dTDP-glucose 4,6-dehydratase
MGRYLIMPTIIQQLLEQPVIRLGDLTPTRTFLYVDDVVRAFLSIADNDRCLGEVVHVGGEEEITMGQLVAEIAQIMGVEYVVEQDPQRMRPPKSEIYRVSADCSKAHDLLGWRSEVTLSQGLAQTVGWISGGGYLKGCEK